VSDESADTGILRLYTEIEWIKQILASKDTLRKGPADTFLDKIFLNQMYKSVRETEAHYEQ
jgi:leucyl-tRNA synthetase